MVHTSCRYLQLMQGTNKQASTAKVRQMESRTGMRFLGTCTVTQTRPCHIVKLNFLDTECGCQYKVLQLEFFDHTQLEHGCLIWNSKNTSFVLGVPGRRGVLG